jgi:hypothetical protein
MTLEEFEATVKAAAPPAVSPALLALWHSARGEWHAAHRVAQDVPGRDGAWVHAHLHRQEGDLGNARYWYRQAGTEEATDALEVEWRRIAGALLASA